MQGWIQSREDLKEGQLVNGGAEKFSEICDKCTLYTDPRVVAKIMGGMGAFL